MIWQDVVISLVQWVFVLTLLPSVFSDEKPALATSVLTGVALAILAATFATLALWIAAAATSAVSATWWLLAFQTCRRRAKVKQRED